MCYLCRRVKNTSQPTAYGHIYRSANKQAYYQTSQTGNLLDQSVAQATDEPDGEQHCDDDVNCLHYIYIIRLNKTTDYAD